MATATMPADRAGPLAEAGLTRAGAARIDAIDMLRGLVIVLMVLDHVRDYFHVLAFSFDPTDPDRTTPALFATRWVTHLCAVSFVFLSGVSIHLQRANGKARLSRFLVTRGLWLILLEVTLVSFGFNFGRPFLFLQVIWAIGASMVAMALLVRLPGRAVLAIGLGILFLSPLAVTGAARAGPDALWARLSLVPGLLPGAPGLVAYPFVPWLGVMCLGFGLGPLFQLPPEQRKLRVALLGLGLIALFLILRLLNGYGDPVAWSGRGTAAATIMSFLNVSKYPPSPMFVLAALGTSLLVFRALEHLRGAPARVLLTFGRTPLFTYLVHVYLVHGAALLAGATLGFPAALFMNYMLSEALPKSGWGFSLAGVYIAWALVVAALYPLARWYEGVRRRRRDWWLSYL